MTNAAPVFEEIRCGVWGRIGERMTGEDKREGPPFRELRREIQQDRMGRLDHSLCESPSCAYRGMPAQWLAIFTDASQQEICRFCAINFLHEVGLNMCVRIEHLIRLA